MPTIVITKSYADGDILFEADLDSIIDDIEDFLNVTKINDDNIQNAGITASDKLVDASISTAKIASAAVTTSKIADSNVTTAKINDSAVTTAKIADSNVTTAKINDGAVTQAKRAALGQQISTATGTNDNYNTFGYNDVTNLTVSITTTGRPVQLGLIYAADTSNPGRISLATGANYKYVRGSTDIAVFTHQAAATIISAPTFLHIDTPAAGTYTYKMQISVSSGASNFCNVKLVAFEL